MMTQSQELFRILQRRAVAILAALALMTSAASAYAAPEPDCYGLSKANAASLFGAGSVLMLSYTPSGEYSALGVLRLNCSFIFAGLQSLFIANAPTDQSMTPDGFKTFMQKINRDMKPVDGVGLAAGTWTTQDQSTVLMVMLPGNAMVTLVVKGFRNLDVIPPLSKSALVMIPNIRDVTPPGKVYHGWIESHAHPLPGTSPTQIESDRGWVFVDDETKNAYDVSNFQMLSGHFGQHVTVSGTVTEHTTPRTSSTSIEITNIAPLKD